MRKSHSYYVTIRIGFGWERTTENEGIDCMVLVSG